MRRSSLLVLVAMLAFSVPAVADKHSEAGAEAEAARLVAEGKRLGESGFPEKALEKFRMAERRFPRAVHLCNIAIAYQTMRNLPLALLYLERCRNKAESFPRWLAAKHGEIAARVARTHAPVEIRVKPSTAEIRVSALGDDEPIASGERVFVPRGEWTVVAKRGGYETREERIEVKSLAGQLIRLRLEREAGAVSARDDAAVPLEADVDRQEKEVGRGRRAAPWILLGAGAASAGLGALFHVRSLNARDEARALPPGPEFDARNSAYRRDGWIAAGAYGVGAVGVAAGVILLLRRDDAADDDPALALALGGGDVMLSMTLTFAR